DAGHTLTLGSLKDGISLKHLIETSRDLSDYADDAIAIVRDEYKPQLDCREGCSYCCCKPGVLVAIPELLRILDHVQTAFDAEAVAAMRERARRYVGQLAGRSFDDPTDQSVPCPLLIDGRCSVYDVRPLTCRGYNSTSVDACRQAHESTSVLVPIFALIKDVTDGTTVGFATRLREIGFNDALVDLGTALNIALETGGGFSEAIVGGADALLPAQNSTWVDELWTQVRQTARQIGVDV
ncbi:MAG: YkgJ family cysteine cluster protein, partial [Vicinamibacterales bacterium]